MARIDVQLFILLISAIYSQGTRIQLTKVKPLANAITDGPLTRQIGQYFKVDFPHISAIAEGIESARGPRADRKRQFLPSANIVGGKDASIPDAPWQSLIVFKNASMEMSFCGATIVHSRAVLTAAHCCAAMTRPDLLYIKYGGAMRDAMPYSTKVAKVVIHPKWNVTGGVWFDSDMCVMIVEKPFVLSPNTEIMEIADTEPKKDDTVFLTGWGYTDYKATSRMSVRLQMTNLKVVDKEWCRQMWDPTEITTNMFCAVDQIASSCRGDSGGPLIHKKKLVGIVSFGNKFCNETAEIPNVFATAAIAKPWVLQEIKAFGL